jgi:hypothetical protein
MARRWRKMGNHTCLRGGPLQILDDVPFKSILGCQSASVRCRRCDAYGEVFEGGVLLFCPGTTTTTRGHDTMTDDTTIVPGCFVRHPTRLRVEGCVREVRGDLTVVAYPNDVQLLPVGELERTARRPAYVSGARHSTPDQRS